MDTDIKPKTMEGLKIILAVALQAAILIYYVGSTNATYNARFEAETVRFENDERRLLIAEQAIEHLNDMESQVSERLARVETRIETQLETSRRIETIVQGMARRNK